jgi:hypothetical protein
VFGLIIISLLLKFLLVVRTSKFDGIHSFIINFSAEGDNRIVAFSPQNNSISILNVENKNIQKDFARELEVPIDGSINFQNSKQYDVSSAIIRSALSMKHSLSGLTILDAVRLFIFSKGVSKNNLSTRDFSGNFNDAQKSTILTLAFTDPTIYQENKSVEIVNAADVYGLGNRLATLITNIGGNVVLVSTSDKIIKSSTITYYQNKSYTAKKLSEYLGIPAVESDKKGVADVIITIGEDMANSTKF